MKVKKGALHAIIVALLIIMLAPPTQAYNSLKSKSFSVSTLQNFYVKPVENKQETHGSPPISLGETEGSAFPPIRPSSGGGSGSAVLQAIPKEGRLIFELKIPQKKENDFLWKLSPDRKSDNPALKASKYQLFNENTPKIPETKQLSKIPRTEKKATENVAKEDNLRNAASSKTAFISTDSKEENKRKEKKSSPVFSVHLILVLTMILYLFSFLHYAF